MTLPNRASIAPITSSRNKPNQNATFQKARQLNFRLSPKILPKNLASRLKTKNKPHSTRSGH